MSVKAEPVHGDADHPLPLPIPTTSQLPQHGPLPSTIEAPYEDNRQNISHREREDEDDDKGAIEIADNDADEDNTFDATYGADTLLGTTSVLTGGEEAPPLLLTRDYAAAFFNTDPRISFDALHVGALRAIEKCEGMTRSDYDYPSWYVPEAKFVGPSASSHDRLGHFTVPAMHPLVRSRPPIEREDRRVDELMSHPTREMLVEAIGPDILEKLRLHRSGELRRRQRREATGHIKRNPE